MLIKMLKTRRISEDAFTVRQLLEGETYNICDSAAGAIISAGAAVYVGPTMTPEEITAEFLAEVKARKAS